MKLHFTTPCYVRIEDAEKRKEVCQKLEQMGYGLFKAIHRSDGTTVFTDTVFSDGTKIDDPSYAMWSDRMMREIKCTHIDCGTNEALFLALAGMRSDTNKGQWFVSNYKRSASPRHRMIPDSKGRPMIDMSTWFDYEWIQVADPHLKFTNYAQYHRATAQEIIEHFKTK